MSGVEVVGVLASATQLAAYSVKIVSYLSQIYKEVQGSSPRIKEHITQLRELTQTAIRIEQHKSLHSSAIYTQLHNTLAEARALSDILTNIASNYTGTSIWGYWALLRGVGEREILARLNKLEREKSNLGLCISLVHTDILGNIQDSLDAAIHGNTMLNSAGYRSGSKYHDLQISQEPYEKNESLRVERDINGTKSPVRVKRDQTQKAMEPDESMSNIFISPGHNYGICKSSGSASLLAGDANSDGTIHELKNHTYQYNEANDQSTHVAGNLNGSNAVAAFFGRKT